MQPFLAASMVGGVAASMGRCILAIRKTTGIAGRALEKAMFSGAF